MYLFPILGILILNKDCPSPISSKPAAFLPKEVNSIFQRRTLCFSLFAVLLLLLIAWLLFPREKIYRGTDALIEKAREVIPVSDVETTEIVYAGLCTKEDKALIWFISGNEYQDHYYLPIEFTIVGKDAYTYVHTYKSLERGRDIAVLLWQRGYAFLINNPDCRTVEITGETGVTLEEIKEDSLPYIFYYDGTPSEYRFLDAEGQELR